MLRQADKGWIVQILLPATLIFGFFVFAIFAIIVPYVESRLVAQKREQLRELVDSTHAGMSHFAALADGGTLSVEEAQQLALDHIRALRYGPADAHYFWICNGEPRMIMHPLDPGLEGRLVADFVEPTDRENILASLERIASTGASYMEYQWSTGGGSGSTLPKTSYVRHFDAWGWNIGTGVYLGDVRLALAGTRWTLAGICGAVFLISGAVCLVLIGLAAKKDARRRAALQELRKSEEEYRYLVERANSIILKMDTKGRVTFLNTFGLRYFGYAEEEILGRSVVGTIVPEKACSGRDLETMIQDICLHPERFTANQNENMLKSGKRVWIAWTNRAILDKSSCPMGILCVGNDISLQRDLQHELRQTQKLEAVGTLAGGIAHDFNNLLWAISGNIELALMQGNDEINESLSQALSASKRAKSLVGQILAFSRRQEEELRPVHLTPIVKETAKLLRASVPATIEMEVTIDATHDVILGDGTQMQQILMNLCTNAVHAMAAQGGNLRITAQSVFVHEGEASTRAGTAPGPYYKLTVSDTGTGIPEDVADRILEPYFTTKEAGEGTGLGLAVVHGIIDRFGGSLRFSTHQGKGSEFYVLLPLVEQDAQSEDPHSKPETGTEHILLVDDQEEVRTMLSRLLERLGYQVTACDCGARALQVFDASPELIDLVVTDRTMPGMTGEHLAAELVRRRPELPILLCTGYGGASENMNGTIPGIREVLNKPVSAKQLSQAIRKHLTVPMDEHRLDSPTFTK